MGRSFPQSSGAERGQLALESRSDPVFARVTEALMQKRRMNLLVESDEVSARIVAQASRSVISRRCRGGVA
jgi:hypothetical protein